MAAEPERAAPRPRRFYHGWLVVAAAFAANVAYSEQFNSTYGVFIYHVGAETGWGRTALAGVKTFGRLPESILAAFIGPLIDRYGARWLIAAGGVVMAASFMLLSTIQEMWQLFFYMGVVMSLGGVCLGGLVTTVAVANWFVLKRGRALGIATMGGSFGTMLLPVLASVMIDAWGWRQTWFIMGIVVLVLVIPAALFVRRRPEDMGLQPDGVEAPSEHTVAATLTLRQRQRRDEMMAADVVWTRRDAIRTPVLWVMVFAWGFHVFSVTGTNLHMVPFFQDLGAPLIIAAAAVSVRSATSLVAHPLWGIVIDRVPIKPAASLHFLITALGIGMWLLPPSVPTLVAGLMLFGIGGGGGAVVSEMIWSGFFGRLSLGTVRGLAFPLQNALGAVGPLAIGLLYDLSGDYTSSFAVLAGGSVVAAILVQLVRPPRPPATTRASVLAREP